MNKILVALSILGAGAGGFLTQRQATTELQLEANATRQAWLAQTQLLAVARDDQAVLATRIGELKQALADAPTAKGNALWSALQTNRADRLPPELREPLMEELGFNWRFSEDFVVVTKKTALDILGPATIRNGQLTRPAATVLALTPEECELIGAALRGSQARYRDWAIAHVERTEPHDDVVAHYSLSGDSAPWSGLEADVLRALDRERADLILHSAWNSLLDDLGEIRKGDTATMIIKSHLVGNEHLLTVEGKDIRGGSFRGQLPEAPFPAAFRPIFPEGWTAVAKAEGFQLPEEPQKEPRAEPLGDRTVTTRLK